MKRLDGKVVLITGAGAGIGRAAAELFATEGARLALIGRRQAPIDEVAAATGALPVACDIASWAAMRASVGEVEAKLGPIDILINNAGVIEPIGLLAEADPESWGGSIDVNLKGVFHGMRAVLPGMIARGTGTILTVSSGAAHRALEGWSAYCAGKAGAAMLTEACHLEAAAHGIRVMGLSPGTVRTVMQEKIRASGINPVSQIDPSAHIPAEWPARALLWMCLPESDDHLGQEVQLREEEIRRRIGLS